MKNEVVKSAGRVMDVFEVFARTCRPLSLSEMASELAIPISSASGLLHTLESKGFVYSLRRRGSYYPTRRIVEVANMIAAHDPILDRARPILSGLRDACDETVVFSKRQGNRVVYLDIYELRQRVRFTASPGELREMHANSVGKALLARLKAADRAALFDEMPFTQLTERTIVSREALEAEIAAGITRGWFINDCESVVDVYAVAVTLLILGEPYGIAVAGPPHRMRPAAERIVPALRDAATEMENSG